LQKQNNKCAKYTEMCISYIIIMKNNYNNTKQKKIKYHSNSQNKVYTDRPALHVSLRFLVATSRDKFLVSQIEPGMCILDV